MGVIKLRVVLALLLVAELGHVRSSPIPKQAGSALARSQRDVSVENPNEEEYDYERSYIDDPNYYPDHNDDSSEENSNEDDAGALARSKRDVSGGDPNEEEYDYERSYIDDPNYYPDEDEDYSEDKSHEDDPGSNDDDPNYYPDEDEDYSEDRSHEDDAGSYDDDPNYYPNEDEDHPEDKSHEDDAGSNDDDPNYYPDEDDDHPKDKSHEDDAGSYDDDPNYYPDEDEDYSEDKSHEDDAGSNDDDPNYYPDEDDDHPEDKSHEDDAGSNDDDPNYYPDEDDDHPEDKSHEDDAGNYVDDPNYYPDHDHDSSEDKSHADDAKSVERRQIKTGHYNQQNGYVKYDVDGAGYNQWQPEINQLDSEISLGVEPLPPVQASDVSEGVEAIDGESDDDSYRTWFYNKFVNVGDAIEDSFDTVRDKFSGAVDTIQDAAGNAADKIHDAAHSTGSTIVNTYHSMKGRFSELRHRIHHLFSSFGLMVQRGADYCIQHLQHTANQVREAEILDKLRQKLKDGNEQVTAFFTILGEKVTSWARSQGHDNVDQGLILVESHGGHTAEEGDGSRENTFPNLFQDQEVLDQMHQMVNQGVITQEELDVLYQQTEQVFGPHSQGEQGTFIESHSRRRNLRSRVTVV